jgi:hypothetical protein
MIAASTMKPDQDHADRSTIEIDHFLTAVWNGLCGVGSVKRQLSWVNRR